MELLEVLCLVDPDFDYQEFGLVESAAVSDSLELIHPRDSIGGNSFSFSIPDRGSEGCWECGQWRGHTEWCERGRDKAESWEKAMESWFEDRWGSSTSWLAQVSACGTKHIFIGLESPLSTYPVGLRERVLRFEFRTLFSKGRFKDAGFPLIVWFSSFSGLWNQPC